MPEPQMEPEKRFDRIDAELGRLAIHIAALPSKSFIAVMLGIITVAVAVMFLWDDM